MIRSLRCWLLGCMLLLCPALVTGQSGSACQPATDESSKLIAWVTGIVTGTDSASIRQRTSMQLPQVAASQISYVTDTKVCSKLVAPYNANVGFQAPATGPGETPSNKLHVVKVGTMYVVTDPALRAGNFRLLATLNKQYVLVWKGLG